MRCTAKQLWIVLFLYSTLAFAADSIVNIYVWGGEVPQAILNEFMQKTGIKVNISTYDNNETMLAKLSANQEPLYDVILPSAYFIEYMRRRNLLTKLDHTRLPHVQNIAPRFRDNAYDPGNQYSIPYVWGATGIVYNQRFVKIPPTAWNDLWSPDFENQLMLLDDARDVFALSLLSLNYSPNSPKPRHLQHAYKHLLTLKPNVKLFASESIQAMLIDEDVVIGSAWNGDAYKANQENPDIRFVYPKEGFVIWIDCLAMPKNPPHPQAAYALIDYILTAQTAAKIAYLAGHAITNQAGIDLLPSSIRNNTMIYPDTETLKRGYVQRDISDDSLRVYNHYWQTLKLTF